MVWAKRAAAQIRLGPCAPSKPANSPTQIATIMAKKSCPSEAWAMVAQAGVRKRTATPPSAACARTTATAAQARRVLWGGPPGPRGSPWTRSSLEEPGSCITAAGRRGRRPRTRGSAPPSKRGDPMSRLREWLAGGPLISDGAWGTQLQARGLDPGAAPDTWNLTHPELVEAVARAYVEAGSQVILTNTFRANAIAMQGDLEAI